MSCKAPSKPEFPLTIKRGSVSVLIYKGENRGRPIYTLTYHGTDGRVRRNFRDLAAAKREANATAEKLHLGHQQAIRLTDQDAALYTAALDALRATGKRLDLAAVEYAAALKELAGKGPLGEAARYFARHHKDLPPILVPKLVEELLAAKAADGASLLYHADLRVRLNRFAKTFRGYIGNVTSADIAAWLRGLGVGPRTRNNFLTNIVTLFNYGKKAGYLARDRDTEADQVDAAKEVISEVEILTPEQMADLLAKADEKMLPFIAIGGFAGLRHWEILRLTWEDVNLAEGHIRVRAEKAKTAQRRIVPISDNLASWLAPFRNLSGPVVPPIKVIHRLGQLAKDAGFTWPRNGLRHSYGTYKLALIKNAAEVSLEMGNSPQMIFRHYREVVTDKQAKAWFGIMPERAKNVVPMKRART